MSEKILKDLEKLLQCPDLASKQWIYQQYDSQVMNDTLQTGGDAAVVRVRGTNKALALTTDCTPRYVEADAFLGAKQAVAETYRNICAVGGKPLAITNCLNFGNPQKPEIMGQIVRSINGITEACKALDYPVVSGNVSLYNETDGKAIQPTPAIGGVGLLKDLSKRCDINFKKAGDVVFVVGKTFGHLGCSLFEREILGIEGKSQPPQVDLNDEKKNGQFILKLIEANIINACHDISDGGLLVALFEMANNNLGFELDSSELKTLLLNDENIFFGEDQSRYLIAVDQKDVAKIKELAKASDVDLFKVGVVSDNAALKIGNDNADLKYLKNLNSKFLQDKIAN